MITENSFKNKVVIVTGAAQGMGKAVSKHFAIKGSNVVLNDMNLDTLKSAEMDFAKSGFEIYAIQGNVADSADVDNIVKKTVAKYGRIDILINNAGVLKPTKVIEMDENEWDFVIDVNLKGTFLFSKAVIPIMRSQNWGRIINFSSTAGKNVSTVGGAHYTSAKAGILGFTRHLAKEVAHYGITVNAVCPGLIDTEMVRKTIDSKQIEEYTKTFPIKRLGTIDEVASLITFLSSQEASYITGASIDINGGDLMI